MVKIKPMRSFTRRRGYAVEHKLPQSLLKAALLKDERAIKTWRAWQSLVDENDLDEASHRLLPLLYQNLSRLGVDQDELSKYKQVYRFYWYKNQLIINKATRIIQSLENSGIECLFLKGFPLAYHYYPNPGLRPFGDVDILVKPADALHAYALLRENNFIPSINYQEDKLFKFRHSHELRDASGLLIDLHRHPMYRTWDSDSAMAFWDDTVSFSFGSQTARTMSASAHLMHACLHGLDWSYVAPVRWAADAAVLINTYADNIDWDGIIRTTERHRLTVQLRSQLQYLQSVLNIDIPRHVLKTLDTAKRWRWEKIESRFASQPPNMFTKLIGFWLLHHRYHPSSAYWRKLLKFPKFLIDMLNIQSANDIFPTFFRKLKEWV